MIVLDASAGVELLLGRGHEGLLSASVHVPELFPVEVLSALRRLERSGAVGTRRCEQSRSLLASSDFVLHPHADLADRVWSLRRRLSVYDAVYVALAEVLDVALVTADRRLARAAHGLVDVRSGV